MSKHSIHDDEPGVKVASSCDEATTWRIVMENEINALPGLDCLQAVNQPGGEKVLHTKFVIRRKRPRREKLKSTRRDC